MSTELVEEELKPYLDSVLNVAIERSEYFRIYFGVKCLVPEELD